MQFFKNQLKWNTFWCDLCRKMLIWYIPVHLEIGYYVLPPSLYHYLLMMQNYCDDRLCKTWQANQSILKANCPISIRIKTIVIFFFVFFPPFFFDYPPIFLYKYSQLVVLIMMIWLLRTENKHRKVLEYHVNDYYSILMTRRFLAHFSWSSIFGNFSLLPVLDALESRILTVLWSMFCHFFGLWKCSIEYSTEIFE